MVGKWSQTAVVVLCWNGKKFLQQFLPTLVEFQSGDSDIVVADNSSTDDSVSFIEKNFPQVRIIRLEKNFGFAEGYNQAIKKIDSEFIVLINQDVAVTKNWLPPLIALMQGDPIIGAVQPRIRSHTVRSDFEYAGAAGGWMDKYGYTFCRGRIFDSIEKDEHQYDDAAEIFWASGACLVLRKKVYEDLGGLDADMFAHMEEIDLCWRLKNNGFKNRYCPNSMVYHLGGGSLPHGNPFKTYLNFRNNLIMMAKNLPREKIFKTILIRIWLDQLAALRSLFTFHFSDFISVWKAHVDFLIRFPRIRKKRMSFISLFPAMSGVYDGSIVWQYFVKKKKTFSEIVKK